jgi:ribosomal protein L37AE/L43A
MSNEPICDECGSPYFQHASQMAAICPECAHLLYGYPACVHDFGDAGRCKQCGWNQARSKYTQKLVDKKRESETE